MRSTCGQPPCSWTRSFLRFQPSRRARGWVTRSISIDVGILTRRIVLNQYCQSKPYGLWATKRAAAILFVAWDGWQQSAAETPADHAVVHCRRPVYLGLARLPALLAGKTVITPCPGYTKTMSLLRATFLLRQNVLASGLAVVSVVWSCRDDLTLEAESSSIGPCATYCLRRLCCFSSGTQPEPKSRFTLSKRSRPPTSSGPKAPI